MYLWLRLSVEPMPFWLSDAKLKFWSSLGILLLPLLSNVQTIFACFVADSFSPSYLELHFYSCPLVILFYSSLIHHPAVERRVLPIHSAPSTSTFCFCFEVIMQELSNQSLIILLHGSRSVWTGSNLINTTFLVSIPLMASAIPSAWLTPWSGSWQL